MDFYKCSDGSTMDEEDFDDYIRFLRDEHKDFGFEKWFDASDFSSPNFFNKLKRKYA